MHTSRDTSQIEQPNKSFTKPKLYRAITFVLAGLCLLEALGESFVTIPFNQYYFPTHAERFRWLRVACLFVAAFLCFAEGYWLLLYRRFKGRTSAHVLDNTKHMSSRRKWWSGSGVFLVCIILAGVVTNIFIRTPNSTGGGAMIMFIVVALAVIFKATFQYLMGRRQKKIDVSVKRNDNSSVPSA